MEENQATCTVLCRNPADPESLGSGHFQMPYDIVRDGQKQFILDVTYPFVFDLSFLHYVCTTILPLLIVKLEQHLENAYIQLDCFYTKNWDFGLHARKL